MSKTRYFEQNKTTIAPVIRFSNKNDKPSVSHKYMILQSFEMKPDQNPASAQEMKAISALISSPAPSAHAAEWTPAELARRAYGSRTDERATLDMRTTLLQAAEKEPLRLLP